jgi:membrane protease subunit HflC
MMKGIAGVLAVLIAIAVFVAYTAVFFVQQTEQALVLRFGEPRRVITEPGLQYKVPFVDTVIFIDKRILDLDNPAQEVIASDQKRLVVDAFARYRITDPLRFYQSIGSIPAANSQLGTILNSALRRVLGESTFIQLVRDRRGRREDPACGPSRSEQSGDLPAHADRAPARSRGNPRAGRGTGAAHAGAIRPRCDGAAR